MRRRTRTPEYRAHGGHRILLAFFVVAAIVPSIALDVGPSTPEPAQAVAPAPSSVFGQAPGHCSVRTIFADVVALDQPFYYNRLGAINANGMMYALRRDVVLKENASGYLAGTNLSEVADGDLGLLAGKVALRADKRPRPLVLRGNVGDCLDVRLTNLLDPETFIFELDNTFPFPLHECPNPIVCPLRRVDDQPLTRAVSLHIDGLHLTESIDSDGSWVGENQSSLVDPGESIVYKYHLLFTGQQFENTFLMYSLGSTVGAEGNGGMRAFGLFGAFHVEPPGAEWYRSQLTRVEMDLATTGTTGGGQPTLNYNATYPAGTLGAKAGLPILNMLDTTGQPAGYTGEIVHSDLNAVISGPSTGNFKDAYGEYGSNGWYEVNDALGDRTRPFREFTVLFHDEVTGVQAFPAFYDDPTLSHTLHGVVDGFGINYGIGGIGSEIIANRLGVGPMWDCAECKYEEFFLASWAVGDPAMIVDIPANADIDLNGEPDPGPKATVALFPDDPSNVHHGYLGDRTVFRNLHAGPKENHIFHLHAHQWLSNSNAGDNPGAEPATYLDSQAIGPGGAYTYEIAYGGAGNRNLTAGDSIFHCHFYPHFAQGMWELWRVHDTFEQGTILDDDGKPKLDPVTGLPLSRTLPDGEITTGTPIPGIVPIPGQAMAPMPDTGAKVVPYDLNGDGTPDSSQIDADGNDIADLAEQWGVAPAANPGYPFYVPGVTSHRPPSPPKDLLDDGGLPRHVVTSGPEEIFAGFGGAAVEQYQTRLDFNKVIHAAAARQIEEQGTAAETVAMGFHAQPDHPSFRTDGTAAPFATNGLPAVRGAAYADPCRLDDGTPVPLNRVYQGANIQMDVTMNKVGWHFPQQRFETLWEDVLPTLNGERPPEPLVMRLNSTDCAEFQHTNLVPNVYELDDYQVRTPTDIIGQHIHLVKFDVLTADGSANGFNYEDGTFSPDEVRERITAFNHGSFTDTGGNELTTDLAPVAHPYFGATGPSGENWLGARTTVQRWYADPLLERSWDGGLGAVFTHDHYGPSTHQQVGLYSTVLIEPDGSEWRDPETGQVMGGRADGGPTSWRADILTTDPENSHREFYFEFADFQHAYEAGGGALGTILDPASGQTIPSYDDFGTVVNPSHRQEPPSPHLEDIVWFPPTCPGGAPRPCPEAISADDPGTYVVNYRNEPLGLRVYDPATKTQAAGLAGDLAFAFQSRDDRAIPEMNGDPFTPMMRVYQGDNVRIRVQVGAHEEEHNFTLHGLKWLRDPFLPDSGWRASQAAGISEYFNLNVPIVPGETQAGNTADYLYTMGAQTEDLWNGVWGILRSYAKEQRGLLPLPNNEIGRQGLRIVNANQFNEVCPVDAPERRFKVVALRAADVLGPDGIVYNDRDGRLIDPAALMYVMEEDVVFDGDGLPEALVPGTPIEPLVLRVNAGDCAKVTLHNALPPTVPDAPGFSSLPPIVRKEAVRGGYTTFNANDVLPSSNVGLHTQLLATDVTKADGANVGQNPTQTVPALDLTEGKQYTWYAGHLEIIKPPGAKKARDREIIATPVEFGVVNLTPADPIEGTGAGLLGALVVEPLGATWQTDPGSNVAATVTKTDGTSYREFVTILQNDVNLRFGDCADPWSIDCAVPNIAGEGGLVPEDPQDSGQKAINYGADPLWFRLGIDANTGFSAIHRDPAIKDAIAQVFSNTLARNDDGGPVGDPQTAVFLTSPNGPSEVRVRVVQPGGHARGIDFTIHGHAWQRSPYTNNSTVIDGANGDSLIFGQQEMVSASSHFDAVLPNFPHFPIEGDYLFRDQGSFGSFQGLWGILRHRRSAPVADPDVYAMLAGGVLDPLAANGVLVNDLDLDGDPMFVAGPIAGPANGTLDLNADGSFVYTPNPGFAGEDVFTYQACDVDGCSAPSTVYIFVTAVAPVASDDAATTAVDTDVDIAVLANDTGTIDPTTVTIVMPPADPGDTNVPPAEIGTAVPQPDGSIRYTPPAGFTGTVAFTYVVSDGGSPGAWSNIATVTVQVGEDPGGDAIAITTAEYRQNNGRWNVRGTGSDPGAAITVTLDSNGALIGSTVVAGDGTWRVSGRPEDGNAIPQDPASVTATSALGGTATAVVSLR